MEDIDKNEVSDNGISEDEDLMMREVIQGDADLCYLHHYLSEVFRKGHKGGLQFSFEPWQIHFLRIYASGHERLDSKSVWDICVWVRIEE